MLLLLFFVIANVLSMFCSVFSSISSVDLTFLPVADHSGSTQLVLGGEKWKDVLASIKPESVVRASGIVLAKPEKDQRKVRM